MKVNILTQILFNNIITLPKGNFRGFNSIILNTQIHCVFPVFFLPLTSAHTFPSVIRLTKSSSLNPCCQGRGLARSEKTGMADLGREWQKAKVSWQNVISKPLQLLCNLKLNRTICTNFIFKKIKRLSFLSDAFLKGCFLSPPLGLIWCVLVCDRA